MNTSLCYNGVWLQEQCFIAFKTYWLIVFLRHMVAVLCMFLNNCNKCYK